MTSVEQLIGDLLLRHNCVIVPSFGGFVAKPIPAKIDFSKGTMVPPSKSLLFNKQLVNNDGLLINEYSSLNGISFDEAQATIETKIQGWNDLLKSGGRIELDRVGHLYFDEEKNIRFEQDRFFNLLLESFGLSQIQFLTEEDVKIVEKKQASIEPVVAIEKEKEPQQEILVEKAPLVVVKEKETKAIPSPELKKARRPIWKYVAAACLLPIGFYSFWIPMKTDVLESGILSIKDFNPFYNSTAGNYHKLDLVELETSSEKSNSIREEIENLPEDVSVYSYKVGEGQFIPVALPIDEKQEQPVVLDSQEEVFSPDAMNYIVGCFGNKDNATNLVAKLKAQGLDGRIVDFHNGLHRVTAGASVSIESFAQIKVQAESLGYTGWTLK